jgi:hypothetical protein
MGLDVISEIFEHTGCIRIISMSSQEQYHVCNINTLIAEFIKDSQISFVQELFDVSIVAMESHFEKSVKVICFHGFVLIVCHD